MLLNAQWDRNPQLNFLLGIKKKENPMANDNLKAKAEMDTVIKDLEANGVSYNTKEGEITGLGDVIESTLQKFGVTEERDT